MTFYFGYNNVELLFTGLLINSPGGQFVLIPYRFGMYWVCVCISRVEIDLVSSCPIRDGWGMYRGLPAGDPLRGVEDRS